MREKEETKDSGNPRCIREVEIYQESTRGSEFIGVASLMANLCAARASAESHA